MMEQSHAGKCHDNTLLVALFDDQIIADRAAGLGDVLHAGGKCTLDIVAEREECIAAQGHVAAGRQPRFLIAFRQAFRLLRKVVLPDTIGANILLVSVDIAIDYIVPVCTPQIRAKFQPQCIGMLTLKPGVSLAAGESCAVYAGLLAGTNTDRLAVNGVANGVGLGVL